MNPNRRQLLRNSALAAGAILLPVPQLRAQALRFTSDPFRLGVASGYPTEHSLVVWTRLATEPLAPDGGLPDLTMTDMEAANDQLVPIGQFSNWPGVPGTYELDSRKRLRDRRPPREIYLNDPRHAAPTDLLTRIEWPVCAKG